MSERILAIDPGENVGWARATWHGEKLRVDGHGIHEWWPFVMKLGESMDNYDTIIYETFRLRADKAKKLAGSAFPTVQCIGIIRYLCKKHPHVKLVSQGPHLQTTGEKVALNHIGGDIKEILLNMPKRHDDAHDGSALKHLAYYYHKNS